MTTVKFYFLLFEAYVALVRKGAYQVSFTIGWVVLFGLNGALFQFKFFPGNEWRDREFSFDILYLRQLYTYIKRKVSHDR